MKAVRPGAKRKGEAVMKRDHEPSVISAHLSKCHLPSACVYRPHCPPTLPAPTLSDTPQRVRGIYKAPQKATRMVSVSLVTLLHSFVRVGRPWPNTPRNLRPTGPSARRAEEAGPVQAAAAKPLPLVTVPNRATCILMT